MSGNNYRNSSPATQEQDDHLKTHTLSWDEVKELGLQPGTDDLDDDSDIEMEV